MPLRVNGSDALRRKFDQLSDVAKGQTLVRALVPGGLVLQNDAKRRVAVLSGNLRRSIHIGGHEDLNTDGGEVTQRTQEPVPEPEINGTQAAIYIGTDVEYARRIEFGFDGEDSRGRTIHQPAQPYLRPAADTNHGEVTKEVASALIELIHLAAE